MSKFILALLLVVTTNFVAMRAQTGTALPYNQNFDATTIAETSWTTQVYGAGTQNLWELSQSTNAGGVAGEVTHPIQYVGNSKTMLISPALNTTGISELKLTFNYFLNSKISNSKAKLIVQSSTDGVVWTDEQWTVEAGNQNRTFGPYTVNTLLKSNTNSAHTYIAFAMVGSFGAINNWSIDNVSLTALTACSAPNTQASGLSFSAISTNSIKADWTRGNGTGVLVVARKGFPVESSPIASTVYSANSKMGDGDCIGDESFVVYSGTGSSVTITNLDQYSDYYFALYEYTADACYNSTPLRGKIFTSLPGTKVWRGLSEDWFDGLNWIGSSVPGSTHNVVLPAGCAYYPRFVGTTTIKSLRIMDGASLLLDKTPNLTVSDSMMIHGRFDMQAGAANINAVYSYPKSLTYIYSGTFTTLKWAGGPTNDYGYGLVHVYGGKLNVTGNMRLAYTANNTAGLYMSGLSAELNIGGSLNFSTKSQFNTGTINLFGTNGAGPFEFAQQSGGTDLPAAFHLNVNAPSKIYKFNNGVTGKTYIYGNLNILAGTVKLTEGTTSTSLDISGNITIGANGVLNCGSTNAGITMEGNWDNYSSATFIHSNNTVLFNGQSHKISGSTTFYGLKINPGDPSVVTFASGSANKVTVTGPLTISTNVMGKLALRSDVPGTQWEIDPQGTRTISNVDVRDSKNVNATAIDATSVNSINTGNNTNWTFGTTVATYISKTVISNFGSVVANSFSTEATFDFSGVNLTSNITITAPAGFQISKTTATGFTNNLTYSPVSGGVPYQTVYVRMNPTTAGAQTGNIFLATTGVTTKTIAVSGTGTAAVPIIILNPSTVSNYFGVVPVYSSSPEFSYTVYGSNLTSDLTLTVTGEFEITKTSGSDYSKTLTFTQTGGYASGTVYCRFSPKGYYSSGVITHSSAGATNKTAGVSGNGSYQGTLTTSKTSIADFGNVVVGESSAIDSFTVQGTGLYTSLDIKANDGFMVSSKKNGTFRNTWTLSTVNGLLNETKLYVKFVPAIRGAKQGLIEIASSNSMYRYVTLSGTGTCSATPKITTLTSSISFSSAPLNTYSEVIPFVWGGCSLTDAVNLTASSDFEISVYADKGFTNSINFSPLSGNINDTTVYIRTKPLIPNYYGGELTIKSTGADDKVISLGGTGFYVGPPMLFVNPTTIPLFETTDVDSFSLVQSYILSGNCLKGDVTITAPEGFLISIDDSPLSSFGSTLTIANGGNVYETPIFVVFNPKAKKSYSSSITHSSAGAPDKLVNVSGICAHSVVTLSTGTIQSFGYVEINSTSTEKSFTVSGKEITYDVIITAPEFFEVSTTSGSGFSSEIILTATAGTLNSTTVFVRFKPLEKTDYTGEISVTCGSIYHTVQLSGSGIVPFIAISPETLPNFGTVKVNSASDEKSFEVSGTELYSNMVITAPAGFEVSATSGSGYSASITLTVFENALTNTMVYVRFRPNQIRSYSDNMLLSSSTTKTILLTGEGIAGSTSVKTIKNEEAFIYPNPADRVFYIRHELFEGELTIGIYDLEGRCFITKQVKQNELSSIDVTSLPTGIYLVKLTNKQTVYTNKLFKNN